MIFTKTLLTIALSSALCRAQYEPENVFLSLEAQMNNINYELHQAVPEAEQENAHRYIVKYGTETRGLRGRRRAREIGEVVMSLPTYHFDVMILDSDDKVTAVAEDDSVEYVERGKLPPY